jgi:hypothetical protein
VWIVARETVVLHSMQSENLNGQLQCEVQKTSSEMVWVAQCREDQHCEVAGNGIEL